MSMIYISCKLIGQETGHVVTVCGSNAPDEINFFSPG